MFKRNLTSNFIFLMILGSMLFFPSRINAAVLPIFDGSLVALEEKANEHSIAVNDSLITSSIQPPQISTISKDWTIMVYLDGDNNLEDAAIDDINEMERGGGTTEDVNVIALVDRHPAYDASNGDWTGGRYYKILADDGLNINSQLLADLGEVDMSAPETLDDFLRFCFSSYPAEHYALVIWDHGSGVFGVCYDETTASGVALTIDDVQTAIKSATTAYGESIDIVAFDCCLMGMVEVAYELRNFCDYFIASEESIPWGGFDYELIVGLVNANSSISAEDFAISIIDAYEEEYANEQGTCLSLIDEKLLVKMIPHMKNLVGNLTRAITEYEHSYIIMFARQNSRIFSDGLFIDFKHFLQMLQIVTELEGLEESCTQLLGLLEEIIVYNWQHPSFIGTANGLSIFFPISDYQLPEGAMYDYANKTRWFTGLDWSSASEWGEFMRLCYDTYQLIIPNDPPVLSFEEESGLQSLNLNCHDEFTVFIEEEGPYEFMLTIHSGDADLALGGGGETYGFQMLGTSELENPLEGQNETIRLFLEAGKYYLFIQSNSQTTTYTILVQHYHPIDIKVNSTITGAGGSSTGDTSGHYIQELHHYFSLNLAVDAYTIVLNNSPTSAYQIIIYALNWTVLASYTTVALGETISFTFNSSVSQTIFIEVFAAEGAGSFSLQVLGKIPTNNQGYGFLFSSLLIFGGLLMTFLLLTIKRRRMLSSSSSSSS